MDAWDRSFRSALIAGLRDNWWLKGLSVFSPDYFWLRQITLRYVIDYFHGSFEKHGLYVYHAHYRLLEDVLGERECLEWTVEDGWYSAHLTTFKASWSRVREPWTDADHGKREPLCAFLGKPVPEMPFPSGNATPAFLKKISERRKPQYRQARVNMAKTLGVVVAAAIAVWMAHARLV